MKNRFLAGSLFTKAALVPAEKAITAAIKDYLERLGVYHLRLNSGKAKGFHGGIIHLCEEGTPDRFVLIKGKPVFIEVKKPGEKPSEAQLNQHRRIRENGGFVIVAESVSDVQKGLREILS